MVQVKVQQGVLAGEQLKTIPDGTPYYSFKGIPYAEPPVGKLRFKAPRPPLPWDGVRNATEHGPKCPQMDLFTQQKILSTEDCLYLNVYSPDIKPASPLPVMVFFHGGGYLCGSGDDDLYSGNILVNHGVILVTLNYRLEVLGFLCLDTEEVPGNAGMKDQVAALRWVRDNIASFGGDPNNVTIFGESAGGAAVVFHTISPLSKGLFKKAICMSGVPSCDWGLPFVPQKRAFLLGKQLGINTKDPQKLLDFLQNVPVEKLLGTNPAVLSFEDHNNHGFKHFHFTPVIEKDFGKEHFLTEEPSVAIKNGRISDVDLFIGYTSEEALCAIDTTVPLIQKNYNQYSEQLVPREIIIKSTPETVLDVAEIIEEHYFAGSPINVDNLRKLVTFASEAYFVTDVNRFLSHLPKVGSGKRYMYKFSCVSGRNFFGNSGEKYGIVGAAHLDDVMYLFEPKLLNLKLEKDSKEHKLVNLVCKVFTNFAKFGNPTPDDSLGAVWPEYDNASKRYVNIGDSLTEASFPDAVAVKFWKTIYEHAGLEW
ncbi:unnamed protein product [Chrysodeixis includens]|uniref:Carboxylic ester hydrolase n=1 Tax=Chrysodeixis includens TaxID=689277 RepID=A0A9N8Q1J9_CHRIL|nr:unnamed protein product [Chrysodeixis includens]